MPYWRQHLGAVAAFVALVYGCWWIRLTEKPDVQALLARAGYERIELRTRVIDVRRCGRGLNMPIEFTAYRQAQRFVGYVCLTRGRISATPG